jgi:hypothetical protein
MDRKAAVLLVSRALSVIQGICALVETSYLPERLISFLHYAHQADSLNTSGQALYLLNSYRTETAFLFVRIGIYLILAVVFWNCGPWVERTLQPEPKP